MNITVSEKTVAVWAVVNPKTRKVAWTRTAKRPAVYNTRTEARYALANGDTVEDGKVVRLTSVSN
jgi:hypothetical protein